MSPFFVTHLINNTYLERPPPERPPTERPPPPKLPLERLPLLDGVKLERLPLLLEVPNELRERVELLNELLNERVLELLLGDEYWRVADELERNELVTPFSREIRVRLLEETEERLFPLTRLRLVVAVRPLRTLVPEDERNEDADERVPLLLPAERKPLLATELREPEER